MKQTKNKISKRVRRIISLRKEGLTTYDIASELGISRSSVSGCLAKHGLKAYTVKKINLNNNQPESLGEFFGIFCGDGSYYKSYYKSVINNYVTRIYFSQDEKEYATKVCSMLTNLFNKRPIFYQCKTRKTFILKYNSKMLGDLLRKHLFWKGKKTYTIRLRTLEHSREFLKGFVRGFLDCDGYTYENQTKISMFSVSKKLMQQIYEIVSSFGFQLQWYVYYDKRKNRKPMYFVNLTKKQAIKFIKFVNSRNPKRIGNGAEEI